MPSAILKSAIPPWLHSAKERENTMWAQHFLEGALKQIHTQPAVQRSHPQLRWWEAEQNQPHRSQDAGSTYLPQPRGSPTKPASSTMNEHPSTGCPCCMTGRSRKKKLKLGKKPSSVSLRGSSDMSCTLTAKTLLLPILRSSQPAFRAASSSSRRAHSQIPEEAQCPRNHPYPTLS